MYKVNTTPHGKCFVWYIHTCFCIRNLTCLLPSLVQFLIRQQLVRKYCMPVLSVKYSKSGSVFYYVWKRIKFFIEMIAMLGWVMKDFLSHTWGLCDISYNQGQGNVISQGWLIVTLSRPWLTQDIPKSKSTDLLLYRLTYSEYNA